MDETTDTQQQQQPPADPAPVPQQQTNQVPEPPLAQQQPPEPPAPTAAVTETTWPQKVADGAPEEEDGIGHHMPTLTQGSQGDAVVELVRLLKGLGYATNTVAQGVNYQNVLDLSVMTDVRRFCADYDVANDPQEWVGREQPPQTFQDTHVGPYIWEALYRLNAQKTAQAAPAAS